MLNALEISGILVVHLLASGEGCGRIHKEEEREVGEDEKDDFQDQRSLAIRRCP